MYTLTNANFEEFYMDHFDEFLSFTTSRVSDKDIAIDICQECFIKTLEHIHRGNIIETPRGYVYTLLRNRIIDFYRKKKTVSLDDYTETGGDVLDEEKPTDRIYYQRLIDKLGELPDTYRDIIIMRFVMDLSVTDIAERLGLPENTVSVRIFRGKELAMQLLSAFKE
jgi:RNA polymerase sigma-70 factor (ECF subfamily)